MNSRAGRGNPYGGNQRNEEQIVMDKMLMNLTLSVNSQCFKQCINAFNDDRLSQSEITCLKGCAGRQGGAFQAMSEVQGVMESKGQAGGMF